MLGAGSRRPPVKLCVIHHSEEIDTEEHTLELALIAMVGGIRLPVSLVKA
jgi:hypothetical protein